MCAARDRFDALSEPAKTALDAHLTDYATIQAIIVVRNALGVGLYEAQDVVDVRRAQLHLPVRRPQPEPDLDALEAKLRGMQAVAIEATWEGDTYGWMVCLCAIVESPSKQHPRYTERWFFRLSDGGDIRLFNGQVPPWPEAQRARALGEALATRLGIPFFFGAPNEPDLDARRWWDL